MKRQAERFERAAEAGARTAQRKMARVGKEELLRALKESPQDRLRWWVLLNDEVLRREDG